MPTCNRRSRPPKASRSLQQQQRNKNSVNICSRTTKPGWDFFFFFPYSLRTERETSSVLISAVIKMELNLSDGLVPSVYNQQRATASDVNHIEVIREFRILARSVYVPATSAPFSSGDRRDSYR